MRALLHSISQCFLTTDRFTILNSVNILLEVSEWVGKNEALLIDNDAQCCKKPAWQSLFIHLEFFDKYSLTFH